MEKDVARRGYPNSYVEHLWDDMYLEGRWSLPINSNPYLALKPPPVHAAVPAGSDPQVVGASRWVVGALSSMACCFFLLRGVFFALILRTTSK